MLQITVVSASGSRYPIAWFIETRSEDVKALVTELRKNWTAVLVHEVDSAVMNGVLVDRTCWSINGERT